MTVQDTVRARCACGASQDVALHRTVDAATEPDLAAALLEGELNVLACTACGARSVVSVPLLYRDARAGLVARVCPDPAARAAAAASLAVEGAGAATVRLVASCDELVEKVAIAAAGLDDRLVEVVKLVTRHRQDPGPGFGPLLFVDVVDESPRRELRFFLRGPEGALTVHVDFAVYENARALLEGVLPAGAPVSVDQAHARALLASSGARSGGASGPAQAPGEPRRGDT